MAKRNPDDHKDAESKKRHAISEMQRQVYAANAILDSDTGKIREALRDDRVVDDLTMI